MCGRRSLSKEKIKKIKDLRKKNYTFKEIAEELEGVSQYTAHKYGKDVKSELKTEEEVRDKRFKEGVYEPNSMDLTACYRLLTGKGRGGTSKDDKLKSIIRASQELLELIS